MDAQTLTLHFPWEQLVTGALTFTFGLWAWTLRSFGNRHIKSLDALTDELKEMRRDVNNLGVRVAVIEARRVYE